MFKINEYFDGKVKSLAFEDPKGSATIGVMAPGEYEFKTSQREYMTVISGKLTVKLPDATDWKVFDSYQTFIIEPKQKFQLKISDVSSYICRYEDIKEGCKCPDCNCR
jgi:purine/pyrimidine-nucleoside phosphorylase